MNARCKPQNIGLPPADLLWRKLLGLREFILFLYFKGLLWPDRRDGCSWSTPSPSWCRVEPGGLSTAFQHPGMACCTALDAAFRGTIPNPSTSRPASQGTGGWHPQPSTSLNSSHLKQLVSPLLKCVSRVSSCMSLKSGLASQGGRTPAKSFKHPLYAHLVF